MQPHELMHGDDFNGQDLSGWIGCEKFDGFRAYWDGAKLWTREGNDFRAPQWFIEALPTTPLDGELFAGYGKRGVMTSVHAASNPERWRALRLMAFDAPGVSGGYLERLQSIPTRLGSFAARIEAFTLASTNDGWNRVATIMAAGGEGVMAHHPKAAYRAGRVWVF